MIFIEAPDKMGSDVEPNRMHVDFPVNKEGQMASLNRIQLIGNLGKDPELRYTKTQTPFARFTMATTEEFTSSSGEKQKKTQWHNLVVWGKQAEIANRYLHKGKQIYVEGKVEYRDYEDQNGQRRYITDIRVDRFLMLGPAPRSGEGGGYAPPETREGSAPTSYGSPAPAAGGDYDVPESDNFHDDDIPF